MRVPIEVLEKTGLVEYYQELSTEYYNCWNFTKFYHEHNTLYWEECSDMERWLKNNTRKIKKPKKGDIGVMRNYQRLEHTFIVLDTETGEIIHKAGEYPLEVTSLNNENLYQWYGKITEYRRFKKGGEELW